MKLPVAESGHDVSAARVLDGPPRVESFRRRVSPKKRAGHDTEGRGLPKIC
jgi:hypothetical protein